MKNNLVFNQIYYAIKKDNLGEFSRLASSIPQLNISFGKFPILSLCYMYNSRKIIRKFEDKLIQYKTYETIEEYPEIYNKFKKIAKRALRLYLSDFSIVSPLEMLLLLGKTQRLTKVYEIANKDETIKGNLRKIELIRSGKEVQTLETKIICPRLPMTKLNKKIVGIAAVVMICLIVVSLFMAIWVNNSGFGSETSPYVISTTQQLKKALDGRSYCKLGADINISELYIDEFNGKFDGAGYTIYVDNSNATSIISTLNGCISNVKFVITIEEMSLTNSYASIVNDNQGNISNVSVYATASFNINGIVGSSDNINVSILALTNNGVVEGCSVSGTIDLVGLGANASFASICGINNSTIINCDTSNSLAISSENVDIAGCILQNQNEATIDSVVNNGTVSQVGNLTAWNPNCAGVLLINYGTISNCENNGKVYIESTIEERTSSQLAALGGIVCYNYNSIKKCKNNGELEINSKAIYLYVGGIVAFNTNTDTVTSSIENSASTSKITINKTEDSAFTFAGGIAAYSLGNIQTSYSCVTTNVELETSHLYFGGVIGCTSWLYLNYSSLYSSNYYLTQTNVIKGVAAYLYNNQLYPYDNSLGILSVDSKDELEKLEIYW